MAAFSSYELGSPSFIEPTQAFESEGVEIVQAVFDSLVQFDFVTGEIKPDVATKWEANADATVWTFNLGESKFHNGRAVTAADFKYAWERICQPSERVRHLLPPVGRQGLSTRCRKAPRPNCPASRSSTTRPWK